MESSVSVRPLSEAEVRSIVDHSLLMLWRADAEGNWDFVSDNLLDFFDCELEDVRNAGWLERLHPEDRGRVCDQFEAIVASGEAFQLLVRARRFDGDYRWLLLRGAPIHDEPASFVGSALDVTNDVEVWEVIKSE
jgi:PAS domain S-box-containing protein